MLMYLFHFFLFLAYYFNAVEAFSFALIIFVIIS